MKMRNVFNSCQKGFGYFSVTTGAMSLLFALIAVFTGGISLLISVPISIGVGIVCGSFGARSTLDELKEIEQSREVELQLKEQERLDHQAETQAIDHIQKNLDAISHEMKEYEQDRISYAHKTQEKRLNTNGILSVVEKMPSVSIPANDDRYAKDRTEVKVICEQNQVNPSIRPVITRPADSEKIVSCCSFKPTPFVRGDQ